MIPLTSDQLNPNYVASISESNVRIDDPRFRIDGHISVGSGIRARTIILRARDDKGRHMTERRYFEVT